MVEDEDDVRELIADILKEYGYSVLEARDPREARARAENFRGVIDLLITDIVMPNEGGRRLAEQLGPTRPDMKILYISGHPARGVTSRFMLEPDTHFLPKPFNVEQFARKIREILAER